MLVAFFKTPLFFLKNKRQFYFELKRILGFQPGNLEIYELAFVHKSASLMLPDGSLVNNERLEYLGDAILDAVVADHLFNIFPHRDEGFLSQMRSKIVKRKYLNLLAKKIGLHGLIISNTSSSERGKHIYGDAFEALVGAVYLDKGYKRTRKFIVNNIINKYINMASLEATESDFKSRLIEWAQKKHQEIIFESFEEYGEGEHVPVFVAEVKIDEKSMGTGRGNSKKEAEQNAAGVALELLHDEKVS